jgi:hypothetical protein
VQFFSSGAVDLSFAEAKEPFGRFFHIEENGNQTNTEFRFTTTN